MSGARTAAPPRRARPHPAVSERRRRVARDRGRRRRSGALFILGTAAAVVAVYWLLTGPLLAIQGVSISGYERDDRADLARALQDAAEEGTILSPPEVQLRAAARSFPWVGSIVVGRDWPRGLDVRVIEAVPVAAAAAPPASPVLVTGEGRVLGPVTPGAGVGWLRLAEAPPPPGATLPAADRAALEFLSAADPDAARRVRALRLDRSGALMGRVAGGPELRLGTPERLAAKATAFGLVLSRLSAEDEAAATYLDLSVPEWPALGSE